MLNNDIYTRIQNNPKFHELVEKRRHFAWLLSAIILLAYYSFILTIAFFPTFLGRPISDGMVTTLGIPIGMVIIFLAFILNLLLIFLISLSSPDNAIFKVIFDFLSLLIDDYINLIPQFCSNIFKYQARRKREKVNGLYTCKFWFKFCSKAKTKS